MRSKQNTSTCLGSITNYYLLKFLFKLLLKALNIGRTKIPITCILTIFVILNSLISICREFVNCKQLDNKLDFPICFTFHIFFSAYICFTGFIWVFYPVCGVAVPGESLALEASGNEMAALAEYFPAGLRFQERLPGLEG